MSTQDPRPEKPGAVSLADEEAVKQVLVSTVLGLWEVVNNLTRLRPSKRERYRVTLFVNNVFDENYVTALGSLDGLYGNTDVRIQYLPREAERYAGIRLRYSF